MTAWLAAALLGIALALVTYRGREVPARRAAPLVALRALAFTLLLALLFGAPAGRGVVPAPMMALDASQSLLRGDSAAARKLRESMARMTADTVWLFGDSLRPGTWPAVPADASTHAAPAVARARATGRAIIIVSDGEIDDAAEIGTLPPGSMVVRLAHEATVDVGVTSVESPRSAVAGDTIMVRVTLRTGDVPVPRAELTLLAGGHPIATRSVDSLQPRDERVVEFRAVAPPVAGATEIAAIVRAAGDREPRNDTAVVVLEVARAAGAVFVSSAPDEDMRYLVPVLRGALSLPARGYYRVAAGAWRREGSLEPVAESEVRAALRSAPLAIVHGDTAIFGPPRSATTGSLLLLPTGASTEGEWFATAAPASPVAGALAGTAWDSLPPLTVAARAPAGDWSALTVARSRRYDARAAIVGSDRGRRVAVSGGSGFWRWRFRGGASAGAYDALWGGVLDWLAAERRDPRAAISDGALLRAGVPRRGRRGGVGVDSLVTVILQRRGAPHSDTLHLRFTGGAATSESAPLAPGTYDARTIGGASMLVVNESREWLPRAATLAAGAVGGTPAALAAPPLRDRGGAYLLAIAALCAEWLLRRRAGLR